MKHTADRLVWVTPITFFLTTRSLHLEGICVETHWSSFPPLPMFPKSNDGQKANEGAFYNGTCYTSHTFFFYNKHL